MAGVYQHKRAVCHGPDGSGDGPMKEVLILKPADLTQISKRYGGGFSFWEIDEKIDARNTPWLMAHVKCPPGVKCLRNKAASISKEILIIGRIKALLTYLRSIQK